MTDQTTGGNGAEAAAKAAQMPLLVNAQYIKDLSFELPNAPDILRRLTQQPQIQVNVNVQARHLSGESYEVSLTLNADAKLGEEALFIVELVYAGVFTVQGVAEESLRPLLLIEAPRLLFPFARAVISGLTREGGLPPMLIQPIDFADLYRRQLQSEPKPTVA
jgi:preprotein translocase subunit SecB